MSSLSVFSPYWGWRDDKSLAFDKVALRVVPNVYKVLRAQMKTHRCKNDIRNETLLTTPNLSSGHMRKPWTRHYGVGLTHFHRPLASLT